MDDGKPNVRIFKSDAQQRVKGLMLTPDNLKGDVGAKLLARIVASGTDSGHTEVDGHYFVWFPAADAPKPAT